MIPSVHVTNLDNFVDAVTDACGGAPVFGGCSVDDSATYSDQCYTFKNGEVYEDRAVFLTITGDIKPHFITSVVSRQNWLADTAIVTKSNDNEIIEVNNRPIIEYLDQFGIPIATKEGGIINSAVFIVSDGSGGSYGRSMMGLSEDGALQLFGNIPEGSQITVSTFEKSGVFGASIGATREIIAKHPEATFALVSSCESRHVVLGANAFDGEHMLQREFAGKLFMFAYAGGEICPVKAGKSRVMNHSYCICLI
jgi:hypothetical protein